MTTATPRVLILGTSYVGDGAQGYTERLVAMWAKLHQKINPTCDVLIVDSASPTNPGEFLQPFGFDYCRLFHDNHIIGRSKYLVLSFSNNIGHLNVSGKDGWGRALCQGIELAIAWDYDMIAYQDVDILCTRPVMEIAKRMWDIGVLAACPMDLTYNFIENGLMWLDVDYLHRTKFVERYNWRKRTRPVMPTDCPEVIFENLLGDDLFTLPLRGLRNDFDRITVNNLAVSFPYGLDYLTHCKDFAVYERFLQMKGI